MKKYLLVAGCRNFYDYDTAKKFIDACVANIRKEYKIVIVSGGAAGADALGERYAEEHGFAIKKYLPNWEKYGRSAGPRRNREMVERADYVICFWDGKSRGTKSTIDFATEANKPLRVKHIVV